jgi:DNA polymerase-4
VVSTATYEARRFGVGSAMSMSTAKARCRELLVRPPRFGAYKRVSEQVMARARALGPTEPLSLDEAYVDLGTTSEEDAVTLGRELRAWVKDELGLSVSVGLASTKMVAKLASDDAKPDGLRLVRAGREEAYLEMMPVRRVSGIGPVTAAKLSEVGITTVGELKVADVRMLVSLLGTSAGTNVHKLGRNQDERRVEPDRVRKSVGYERTLEADLADPVRIKELVEEAALAASSRLVRAGASARTVTLKARMWDFRDVSRSMTLAAHVSDARAVREVALELLASVDLSEGVRLLGVTLSGLGEAAQGVLFSEEPLELGDEVEAPLSELVHWNMEVVHPRFGSGRVRELHDGVLSIEFADRVRVMDLSAPLRTP